MRKYYPYSYSLLAGTAILLVMMLPQYARSQKTVRLIVYQLQTTIPDCDGLIAGNSDPAWWFTGVGTDCFETTCNGCTQAVSMTLMNQTVNCPSELPSTVSVRFRGCEDDGIGCTFGAFAGICDGGNADRTDNHAVVTTNGTTNIGPFCANSTGCSGNWCYWAQWVVTGNFVSSPVNDDICNATPLTLGTTFTGNNTCATTQVAEVDPVSGIISPSNTVWHTFVAPVSGHVIVSTDYGGTNFDTEIAIYGAGTSPCPGSVWGNLTELGSNDDITLVFNERSLVELQCLTPGATYYIQVDGNSTGNFGQYQINVSSVGPPIATNNALCNAIPLTLGTTFSGNNECATVQPGEPSGSCGSASNTVWHTFVAPASGHVTVSTDFGGTNFDTEVTVYAAASNPCPATNFGLLSQVGCNDDRTIIFNLNSFIDIECLIPGNTYYVQVDGNNTSDHGNYQLNVSATGPTLPTNNALCNAIPLTLGTTYSGNNNCATTQPGETSGSCGSIFHTVWHTFVAPVSGHVNITTDLGGTNYDTQITLYQASGAPCPASNFGLLSAVGCNDDITLLINNKSTIDAECLTPGATYYLQVGGPNSGNTGNYQVNVSSVGPPLPTHDNICNAIALTLGTTGTFNNNCATVQAGEVDAVSGSISPTNTVWHTFVAPPSGHVIVTTDFGGTQFDTEITVYRATGIICPGPNWGSLVEAGSNDDRILVFNLNSEADLNCLTPGATYFVQVDGNSASDHGQYQIRVTSTGPVQVNNDLICNAINLGTLNLGGTISNNNQNNLCAGISPGEPNFPGCLSGIDQTIWCRFTTGATLGYWTTITALNDPLNLGDQIDLQLGLYTSSNGTCTGTLTSAGCDYTPGFFDEDLNVKCLQPNTTYYVQIDGSALNTQGFLGLSVTDDGLARATNDLRCNATPLGIIPNLGTVTLNNQNNYCGGVEPGEPVPLSFGLDQTVWYSFRPPASGSVEIILNDLYSDAIDLQVAVWESDNNTCTGFFSEVDSYDDPLSFSITGPKALRLKCLDPLKTYFIQVDGSYLPLLDNHVGDFQMIVNDYNAYPAPNDSICNPINLGNPSLGPVSALNQNNFCADNILEPIPSCFGTNMTVWYTFIAPPSGRVHIAADSYDPDDYIDLQIAVFALAGDVCTGAPTQVGCDYNDWLEFPPLARDEEVDVNCLTPGRKYWIMIDGSDDPDEVDGYFHLTVTQNPGPPPVTNDSICDAIFLGNVPAVGSIVSPEYHNFCAGIEAGEPTPSMSLIPFGIDQTVWYTFTAPPSGNMHINATNDPLNRPDNIDLQLAVYESSNNTCTGSFAEVNSDYDPGFFSEDLNLTCLTPGRTYFLQVDGALLPPPPLPTVLVEGYFNLTLAADPAFVPMPTNDLICNRVNLGVVPSGLGTVPFHGSNYCARTEPSEPNVSTCPVNFQYTCDETVWFTFTTNANPGTVTIHVDNPNGIIPYVTVYSVANYPTCAFSNLTFLADQTALPFSNLSLSIPCLPPNTTFYIQLDGVDFIGDDGDFDIWVSDNAVPQVVPANDSICDAHNLGTIPLGGASPVTPGSNICSAEENSEPHMSGLLDHTDPLYDETVWYRFTTSGTPGTFHILVTSVTGGLQTNLHVYRSNTPPSCTFSSITEYDNLTAVLPNNNLDFQLDCLEPNTTYYIQLDGVDVIGDDGNFNIQVTDNGTPHLTPPNDDICNASNIGIVPTAGNTGGLAGHNYCATTEGGEPNVSGCSYLNDPLCDETVWYRFTTGATPGLTTVTVNNTIGIDASINIYQPLTFPNCTFGALTLLEDADDPFSSNVSVQIPCLRPNTTYYVQVDGLDIIGDEGTFNIVVSDDGSVNSYPTNDSVCDAQNLGTIPFGGSSALTPGNNYCAGTEPGEPNVDACPVVSSLTCDETVWYSFVTNGTPGLTTIAITGTVGINAVINVYLQGPSNSCAFSNLYWVASRDDLLSNNVSISMPCLAPNRRYFVQVDGLDVIGDNGTFNIQVSDNGVFTSSPANDAMCAAVPLGNPTNGSVGPVAGNNNCATQESGESNVTGDDETVWYTFVAPSSGAATININSLSGIDANFTLYHRNPGPCNFILLDQVGSANHDNLISFSVSYTEECLIPGDTYYIQIDGGDIFGDFGNFTVTVSDAHAGYVGPANDPCTSAINVPIGTEPCQGSGAWNVYNYGNPTVSYNPPFVSACGANCGDTWYSFTMPTSGTVLLEGNDEYGFLGLNNSTLSVAAYQGPCNNLVPVLCDQGGILDDPQYYINGTPGQTYFLQVFDDGGDDFNEQFALCLTDRCGSDNCLTAQPMTSGIWYCWDTDGANGENIPTQPGYFECGDGTNPGHSVYFSYTTLCPTFSLTLHGIIGGACILGEPTDGISMAVFVDSTPCDGVPQAMLDCEQTDACLGTTYAFTHNYTLPVGTRLIIQIDGFDFTGNNNGQIRIDEACPLDVEYTNFTGHRENNVHLLDWTVTDQAVTLGNFVVERSLDGQQFASIGNVLGSNYNQDGGSSGGSNSNFYDYSFTDENPIAGHNYYRLKFVDQNGLDSYSAIIDLYFEAEEAVQIMGLYPNPARDWVKLESYIPKAGDYEISFTDLYGRIVISGDYRLEEGVNKQRFEIGDMSAGMYIVRLKSKNGKSNDHRKFIKQ
jgi:hypothetical protein